MSPDGYVLTILFLYCTPSELDNTISFYKALFGEKCRMRFQYPEAELELAWVGSVLLIAGSQDKLQPFKNTTATFLVDSVDDYREALLKLKFHRLCSDLFTQPFVII